MLSRWNKTVHTAHSPHQHWWCGTIHTIREGKADLWPLPFPKQIACLNRMLCFSLDTVLLIYVSSFSLPQEELCTNINEKQSHSVTPWVGSKWQSVPCWASHSCFWWSVLCVSAEVHSRSRRRPPVELVLIVARHSCSVTITIKIIIQEAKPSSTVQWTHTHWIGF